MPAASAFAIARGARVQLVGVELAGGPQRVDARAPERLVDVDVPEAGERALVEQRGLDRRFAVREPRGEHLRRKGAPERLGAETRREIGVELARLEQQPRAEAPDVAIGNVRSVV